MTLQSSWIREAPLVIGHRGASAYAPENTTSAFRLALDLGADGLEVDVKLTRDLVPVLVHDPTLDRTTNGFGKVSERSYSEIAQLDAGRPFAPEFAGEPVPTLEQFLNEFAERCLINVELTNYSTPLDPLSEIVVKLISAMDLNDRVVLSSFNPLSLIRVYRIAPEIQLGLLLHNRQSFWIRALLKTIISYSYLHLDERILASGSYNLADNRQKPIHVWTVNQASHIRELMLEPQINGVITDVPDVARTVLDEIQKELPQHFG